MNRSINRKKYRYRMILLLVLWLLTLSALALYSTFHISAGIFNEIGKKAMILAVDIATRLELDSSQSDHYLGLDFEDLLEDPSHRAYESQAREVMRYSDIKYIYMSSILDPADVKYRVEKGEEALYGGAPAGTPLNVIYLLDAVVDDETRMADTDGKWYTDKDRYNILDELTEKAYTSGEPGYEFVEDRWGNYFTGYAPVRDDSGRILGILCVDLYLENYYRLLMFDMIIAGGFIAANLIIGAILVILYRRLMAADRQVQEKTHQSNTDYLTSCLNRRSFIKIAEEQRQLHRRNYRPLALMFVDIDYFKEYNDFYGHITGDTALCRIADALVDSCGPIPSWVCRYGGDEFVILLAKTDRDTAGAVAARILDAVADLLIPHEASPIAGRLTVSIGITAQVPGDGMTVEHLMDEADNALYKAKRYGRDQFQFSE